MCSPSRSLRALLTKHAVCRARYVRCPSSPRAHTIRSLTPPRASLQFPPVLLQHLRSGRGQGSDRQREALGGLLSESDVRLIWDSRHRHAPPAASAPRCRNAAAPPRMAFRAESVVAGLG